MSHRTRGGWRAAQIASEPDRFGVAGGLSYAQGRLRTACGGGQARLMVFTRAEAVADGVSDSELKSLLKRGDHVRLVRGVYADAAEVAVWEEDQHRTRVMGVARITDALHSAYRHRGAPRARAALRLADGRAESPGETWTRLALTHPSLPPCELQIEVYDEHGRFVGRADGGYLEHGVLWEYDGQDKYHRLLAPGQTTLDAVLAEKRRESGFTELGWLVPETLRRRMLDAIARSSRPGWLRHASSCLPTDRRH